VYRVGISPSWTIRRDGVATPLGARVVDLLVGVDEQGSLAAACTAQGVSYRHAWQLLREGEALFGQPLVRMTRGKGSLLTPLGERLVWAQRRVQARLAPLLDTLASEVGSEIEKLLSAGTNRLRIHASHGFAVQALHEALQRDAREGFSHELKYCGGAEALAALAGGQCDIAGFHVPIGRLEPAVLAHYRPWLASRSLRLVALATRRQGLMVAPGNPRRIYGVADLARPGVRFINRQPGSGTRVLLDLLLAEAGIAPSQLRGHEQCEFTHAAVAAFVASGMADAGLGVEVPARSFRLEFLPLEQERYFLLADERTLQTEALQPLLALLASPGFQADVARLPGYDARDTGRVMTLDEAFAGTGTPARPPPAARRRRGARPPDPVPEPAPDPVSIGPAPSAPPAPPDR
jgi:molybdate transport repressor ModE-like protein